MKKNSEPEELYDIESNSVYRPKRNNKALTAVTVTLSIIILLLLAVIALLLFGKNLGIDALNPFVQETTAEPATEVVTTAEPTTEQVTEEHLYEVPDVVGMSAKDAYDKLNSCGVKYTVSREYSETIAADYVISQSPQSGTIKNNEKVILYISKGIDQPDTTAPTTSSKKDSDNKKAGDDSAADYILYQSDSRAVSRSELENLSKQELTLALNEIYARYGRRFNAKEIQSYFDSKPWYNGTLSPSDFDENALNSTERANINLILQVMQEKGYR